jgi:hypothetical protein
LSSSFAISTSAFFSFPCLFHCPDPHTCAFKVREVKVLMSVVRVTYSLKCPDTRSCGRRSWGINRSVMIVLEWGGGEMCGRLINTGSHTYMRYRDINHSSYLVRSPAPEKVNAVD